MYRYDLHRVGNPKSQWKQKLHDQALNYALDTDCNIYTDNSRYFNTNPRNTIFIYKLSPDVNEQDLQSAFISYGYIRTLNLVRDIVTGESKRYAFIEYQTRQEAEKAVKVTTYLEIKYNQA